MLNNRHARGHSQSKPPPQPAPVLVVDDDRAVRASVKWLLEADGYNVVSASSAEQALAMLRRGLGPCMILLDLMMPRMDGVTFRRLQLADERLSAIPVVILSGHTNRRATQLGARQLSKPVDAGALLDTVRQYCSRR